MGEKKQDTKLELPFPRVLGAIRNIKALRQYSGYNLQERMQIRDLVDKLEDSTRALNTKLGRVNEEYAELKQHKDLAENYSKAKKVLQEFSDQKDAIFDQNVSIEIFEKISLKAPDSDEKEKAFLDIYFEYEGLFW